VLKVSAMSSMVSQDLRVAVRFAAERGLDGLDLDRVWEQPIELIAASGEVDPLHRVLGEDRTQIFCLATNLFRCWLDSEAAFQEHLSRLEACLRLAETLRSQDGAPLVRCYAFFRSGEMEDHWSHLLERFEAAVGLAVRYGLILGIQNDAQTFLGTGREVARLVETINNEHLKAVWDPCAAVFDVDRPEIPYPDGYRCLRPHIVHVVLRDVDRRKFYGSLREVELGEGLIDHRRQVSALMADGYRGAVSLATMWRPGMAWDRSPDMADFTEAGGQQAVRLCLDNLRAMMGREQNRS
jgi:sugar phosphate isomerase/epimerase